MPINPICCERTCKNAENRLVERLVPFLKAHILKEGATDETANLVKVLILVNEGFTVLVDALIEAKKDA